MLRLDALQRGLAVLGLRYFETGFHERATDDTPQRGLVIDEQETTEGHNPAHCSRHAGRMGRLLYKSARRLTTLPSTSTAAKT
jgi:hypothetical protein